MSDRLNVLKRSEEERRRAYEQLAAIAVDGDYIEISVCADCGKTAIWDSELFPDPGPVRVVCSHPSGEHLVTRVAVRPLPPT